MRGWGHNRPSKTVILRPVIVSLPPQKAHHETHYRAAISRLVRREWSNRSAIVLPKWQNNVSERRGLTGVHTLEQLRSGALAGARRLDLSCGLTRVPDEVFALADTLEVLNLSDNQLTELPPDMGRLHRLKVVFASNNLFTHLPESLGECPALEMVGFKATRIREVPPASLPPALRWLILTDNAIEHLPDALGERPALQKLMLAGNRLQHLPEGLANAQRLELLRLSANGFTSLPTWLTRLPRLAWLALAGNPLGWCSPERSQLPRVPWSSLVLGAGLGEGA